MMPRKSGLPGAINLQSGSSGFNEAGAMMPRKRSIGLTEVEISDVLQ